MMRKFLKKFLFALTAIPIVFALSAWAAPIPAEVLEDKAFVRADHNSKAKRVATLEEGDAVDLLEEWRGDDPYPWYKIETQNGKGWIYGQLLRRLDAKPAEQQAAQAREGTPASLPKAGVLSSDRDLVMVVAHGQGTDRAKALEQAWIEAVRLAVGAVISSKSELNNDEFAENTVAHSRGVIESFEVAGEQEDGKRVTVAIRAKVQREILADAAKTYAEAQTVKADAGEALKAQLEADKAQRKVDKAQLDEKAKESTAKARQESGVELLKEVLSGYGPEMFYSATLDPKIYYDKGFKKPYLKIRERFNEELFWKDLLPKLRTALDGVAVEKEKKFYSDDARQANQKFAKSCYLEDQGMYPSGSPVKGWAYNWSFDGNSRSPGNRDIFNKSKEHEKRLIVVIPDNNSSYTAYFLPCENNSWDSFRLWEIDFVREAPDLPKNVEFELCTNKMVRFARERFEKRLSDKELYAVLWTYFRKMAFSQVVFLITFFDKQEVEIHSQAVNANPPFPVVWRSFVYSGGAEFLSGLMSFTPGALKVPAAPEIGRFGYMTSDVYLDTKGREFVVDAELDAEDLQKVNNIKFEVIFETPE